jgi:lysophospholipase L1-like esterase
MGAGRLADRVSSRRAVRVLSGCAGVALLVATTVPPSHAGAAAPRRLFVLGDSVTLGAKSAVLGETPSRGWAATVDAKVGRTTAEGASILASMHGSFPSVVVVALGNNDGANPAQFAQRIDGVMRNLAGVRHVVWYTMTPFASWVPAANAVLRAASARWPNLHIADWATVSEATPGALYGVGPHLRSPGAHAWADLLFASLAALDGGTPVIETFDGSPPRVDASATLNESPSTMAASRSGARTWFATPDGQVEPGRGTPSYGSLSSPPRAPIVGMSATASGQGYWLVASDGGVFSFGDASFFGSTGAMHLNQPVVGMSATPSGHGYWFVASDGGVFSFGDARYCGSGVALHATTGASFLGIAAGVRGYALGAVVPEV